MRDALLLIALCATSVLLGRVQSVARNQGHVDVFSQGMTAAVSPVAAPCRVATQSVGDFFGGAFSAGRLMRENRRLKELAAAAALYRQGEDRMRREIDDLRKLHDLPPLPGKQKVLAEVTALFQHESRITISAGLKQGIKPGQPVVAAGGLLAVVQTSQMDRCQALLLSSPALRIGAMVDRNPPSAGLMRGETATSLSLELMDPGAPAKIGDLVVTSGFSERIPRGIPIGRVVQVVDDLEFGSRKAQVFPNVMIGSVREVVILK